MCIKGREGLLGSEKKSWIDFFKSCGNYFICRFYAKAAKKMEKRRGGRKIEQTSVCEDYVAGLYTRLQIIYTNEILAS